MSAITTITKKAMMCLPTNTIRKKENGLGSSKPSLARNEQKNGFSCATCSHYIECQVDGKNHLYRLPQEKDEELSIVLMTNTVVDEWAMMIITSNTPIAHSAKQS